MAKPVEITKVKGKDYLSARSANAMFWERFESDCVDIETHIHTLTDSVAVVIAKIVISNTDGDKLLSVTASKQSRESEFRDYLEKAETGAVRRAMAMLGINIDSVDSSEASGPPQRFQNPPKSVNTQGGGSNAPQRGREAPAKASPDQVDRIAKEFRKLNLTMAQVSKILSKFTNVREMADLTVGQASALQTQLEDGTLIIPE